MKRFLSVIIFLLNFSLNLAQQPQSSSIPLPDDVLQHQILLQLTPLTGKDFNDEVTRLSLISQQYNRVMHRSAVIQLIIKKRLEPIPTKQRFDAAIADLSQNQVYKNEIETSKTIQDLINKKNKMFDIIANQIQPVLNQNPIIIDVVNGKEGINTLSSYSGGSALTTSIFTKPDVQFIKLLLDAGADPNLPNTKGNTPLIIAIYALYNEDKKLPIIQTLIEYGAAVNKAGEQGKTPLIWATLKNSPTMIQLLRAHNANPFLKDNEGETALDYAQYMQQSTARFGQVWDHVISLLKEAEKNYSDKKRKNSL